MSVINQVLNQLEQRGAHTELEQILVRAVPQSKRKLAIAIPLLVLGLALMAGVVVWQWMQAHKPVLSLAEGPQVVAVSIKPLQPAVVALPASAPAVPVATSAIAGEAPLAETLPPTAHALAESSLLPLPPALLPSGKAQDTPLRQAQDRPLRQAQDRPLRQAQDRLGSAQAASTGSGQAASTKPLALSAAEGSGHAASAKPLVLSAAEGSGHALRDGKSSAAPSRDERRPVMAAPLARSAKPQPMQAAVQPQVDALPMKQISPAQHADAEFRKAVASMQQGHITDAIAGYEAVLRLDAGHDAARQALVALLLESKRGADAERVLQDGLKNKPEHIGFAMLLARFQVERGAVDQALATLEKLLPYADQQADYQAFFAALLQRRDRHKEALIHYQIALQLTPDNGVWLMGYGISLQAVQRTDDARNAFRRALDSKTLNPELRGIVQQKLRGL